MTNSSVRIVSFIIIACASMIKYILRYGSLSEIGVGSGRASVGARAGSGPGRSWVTVGQGSCQCRIRVEPRSGPCRARVGSGLSLGQAWLWSRSGLGRARVESRLCIIIGAPMCCLKPQNGLNRARFD